MSNLPLPCRDGSIHVWQGHGTCSIESCGEVGRVLVVEAHDAAGDPAGKPLCFCGNCLSIRLPMLALVSPSAPARPAAA